MLSRSVGKIAEEVEMLSLCPEKVEFEPEFIFEFASVAA